MTAVPPDRPPRIVQAPVVFQSGFLLPAGARTHRLLACYDTTGKAVWVDAASLKGDPGATAYQVATAAGFTGTEQDWLRSLVGRPGDRGPAGDTGRTGDRGATGDAGATGKTGPAGPPLVATAPSTDGLAVAAVVQPSATRSALVHVLAGLTGVNVATTLTVQTAASADGPWTTVDRTVLSTSIGLLSGSLAALVAPGHHLRATQTGLSATALTGLALSRVTWTFTA